MYQNNIVQRTFLFGVNIVRLSQSIPKTAAGLALSNQIVRSGTSVGANVEEAQDGLSKKDFIHSMNIALKEARETNYWLRILSESNVINSQENERILNESVEIIKILTAIVKKSKENGSH